MNYEEIKKKEGTWTAINQALIDCLNGDITGGDFLDILNDLHPIPLEGLSLGNVGNMCPSHKPNLVSYVHWHDWAENQAKKGIKQTKCEKCKRWFFPSEF